MKKIMKLIAVFLFFNASWSFAQMAVAPSIDVGTIVRYIESSLSSVSSAVTVTQVNSALTQLKTSRSGVITRALGGINKMVTDKVAPEFIAKRVVLLMLLQNDITANLSVVNGQIKGKKAEIGAFNTRNAALASSLGFSDSQISEKALIALATLLTGQGLNIAQWSDSEQKGLEDFLQKIIDRLNSANANVVEAFLRAALELKANDVTQAQSFVGNIINLCGSSRMN